MDYIARLRRDPEDGGWLVTFPDSPGCQTDADTRAEALEAARDALSGWLEAHLAHGRVPPRPRPGRRGAAIPVGARLSAALQIRWWRDEHSLTQAEVARRAGVSQQQIAKLENPDANPSLGTLEKVVDALGGRLALILTAA